MKLSFFRVPKHRVFNYTPRFYDEEKERRDQRRRELGIMAGDTEADTESQPGSLIRRGAMRARHNAFSHQMQEQRKRSQRRLLIIIALLIVVGYFLAREYMDGFYALFFNV